MNISRNLTLLVTFVLLLTYIGVDLATAQLFLSPGVKLTQNSSNDIQPAWSPDSRKIAFTSNIRSAAGGEIMNADGGWLSVAFSPGGETLASGSWDGTIRLWDTDTVQQTASLTGHTDGVYSVAFSPDGRTLASGADDGTIRLWDIGTGQQTANLTGANWDIYSVAFSPDGKTLASGGGLDDPVQLWDIGTGQQTASLTGHTIAVFSVAFSPDGKTLASRSWDGTIRLWDIGTGQQTANLTAYSDGIYSIAFSPDGKTLASGGADGTIRLWDIGTGQQTASLTGHKHNANVYSVAFSPDGRTLASGGGDGDYTIWLWDIGTGQQTASLTGHGHSIWVRSLAFSPDGRTLASVGSHGTILLWDMTLDLTVVVEIPDANLRAAVEAALGKASGATITTVEMATLTDLRAPESNIRDLTGLETATNLEVLWLYDNAISDLSALSGLTRLESLFLDRNSISDISVLSGLTNLAALGLEGNNISNLSALSGLANLQLLFLHENNISDLSALSGLTHLEGLGLQNNNISDISALRGLTRLEMLGLGGNSISNLSALSGLTNLETLSLWSNAISDLSALSRLTHLQELYLSGNSISNISALSGLTNLERLSLWNNAISDISALAGLTNLEGELYLSGNSISDVSPLVSNRGLGSGDTVDVRENPLNRVSINTHIPALQERGVTVWFDDVVEIVEIPDANLRAAVEKALGKASGATITTADMGTLNGLTANNANIRDLTGLETATNLITLNLLDNQIVDISALSGLTNLYGLDLRRNRIADLSALSGLTSLVQISLLDNQITDLTALSGLTHLVTLYLSGNQITDLSALSGLMNLEELLLWNNQITDLTALSGLTNLEELGLAFNQITDLMALSGLTNLYGLDLRVNRIADLSALSGLTNLEELFLRDNQITDITVLSGLTNLETLYLGNNQITDLTALSGLTNLAHLNLDNNSISDLSALSGLTNLEELELWNNQITDITALSGLTHLQKLYLSGNSISDLSPLVSNTGLGSGYYDYVNVEGNPLNAVSINTHIPTLQGRGVEVLLFDPSPPVTIPDANLRAAIERTLGKGSGESITMADMETLTELDVAGNRISNFTGLEHATNLTGLVLNNNSISDISWLSGLTNLTQLHLYDNNISDLSPLVSNTGLGSGDTVDVRGNPLNAVSINTHIPTLQGRGVEVLFDPPPPVNIPDANLRAAIESTLGKGSGATITTADMETLTALSAQRANISDLTGLEYATNLIGLSLAGNSVLDISPVAGLTNLAKLYLSGNSISDLSPLVANTGLGTGDEVNVRGNPLSAVSINTHIPALQGRGVTVDFDPPTPVNIPDTNLRAAIESALGKGSGATITTADMETLSIFEALDADNISDLTGLETATRLEVLVLSDNTISDLSALRGLTNLETLALDSNNISDLSSLSGLTNLEWLELENNSISDSDLSSLSGLTNLEGLFLSENQLVDLSSLSGLTNLETLFLSENSISDLSSLSGLTNLVALSLSENQLVDITSLSGLTNLYWLQLDDNSISDISALVANTGFGLSEPPEWFWFMELSETPVVNLSANPLNRTAINTHIPALQGRGVEVQFDPPPPVTIPDANLRAAIESALGKASGATITTADMATLTQLEAPDANISDLTGLETATNLETLTLSGNQIVDLSSLSGLTNLVDLSLGDNQITDITALSGLTSLQILDLEGNNISDISVLAGLTNLARLYLGYNSISDLSALSGLTHLNVLRLSDNPISDLSALSGLTHLEYLWLGKNSISNISVLAGLTNLRELWLDDNAISDLSALSGLTNLAWLYLDDNAISDISVLSGLTNLQVLNLDDNSISDISPLVANTGLSEDDLIILDANPLNHPSIHTHIPALQQRGVSVLFDERTATTVWKISGDNQRGATGAALPQPFVVEVQDQHSEVFAGVPVQFAITEGEGALSVTSTTTDANGRAESRFTPAGFKTAITTVTVEGISEPMTFTTIVEIEFNLSVPMGISLIHVPLKVTAVDGAEQTIESVGALYDALGGASTVNFLVTHDPQTQEWRSYFSSSDSGSPADIALAADTGIMVSMKTPVLVQLTGELLGTDGSSTVTLHQGLNLVGLPLNDSRIMRVSDLFTLDGIGGNVSVIMHIEVGEFKAVGRAGDPGDVALTGGQGFIMIAQQPAAVTISGEAWTNVSDEVMAAPALRGIEVGDTTPVLGLRGAVVPEHTGLNKLVFRVTVKNLSTRNAAAVVTAPDEAEYRLTVVDIEMGRAARIGDTLEISAQSPNPFIGVEPMRYTVTAEDVRQSFIQLPELIAYEIPAETELLRNYPNPFNPETWIPFRLAEDAFVTLTIYDTSGQVVRILEIGHRIAAVYERRSKAIYWDGRNESGEQVASGVYFYQLQAGDYSQTRKLVILK